MQDLYTPFLYNPDKPNRLAIVDPNKADNNVSGGTAEIDLVIGCFSQAYKDLSAQMTEWERSGLTSKSLLVDLLGGDYEAYGLQRERLRRIYVNGKGQNKQPLPPTVSLRGPPGVALPNTTDAVKIQSNVTNDHKGSMGKVSTLPNTASCSLG